MARSEEKRIIYSLIVDSPPKFTYQGLHLVRSLCLHCDANPSEIHVQMTPEVDERARSLFAELGCELHDLERFGDGKYCNKINQIPNLVGYDFDTAILLDTDTIAVSDLRPHICHDAVQAKVVDLPNPSLSALKTIAERAGLNQLPPFVETDAAQGVTYRGNCNGGVYAVPKEMMQPIFLEWRKWALWLLSNIDPLVQENKQQHVDQVGMWLALNSTAAPFKELSSNANYYVHFKGEHRYFDDSLPISLLHYHDRTVGVTGLLTPPKGLTAGELDAVGKANEQIKTAFDNRSFWNLRYSLFPERGSGIGSRGDNLAYKQALLKSLDIENADSVLDIGCGDLEVMKPFKFRRYLGIDQSETAVDIARSARPDLDFKHVDLLTSHDLEAAELVICLEVLIHLETSAKYRAFVQSLCNLTLKTLIISGYEQNDPAKASNHMIYFHESLSKTLGDMGGFKTITKIGAHTDVEVFRCDR